MDAVRDETLSIGPAEVNDIQPRGLRAGNEAWAVSEALGSTLASDLATLAASDLFDPAWYLRAYPDVAAHGIDPATHFVAQGWVEGRRPNFYFDPLWYRASNPDVSRAGVNPVLHYVYAGESEGRQPSEFFDLAWYRTRHEGEPGRTLLAHFLLRRHDGTASPLPEFDATYYLATYPDVAAAGVDPCEHYLLYGFREGRNPSADFDTQYYIHRYLEPGTAENPILHYRRHRHVIRLHTSAPPSETGVFGDVRRHAAPGPLFETVETLPPSAKRHAQVLAFYLPQFHPVPENDKWWGAGFTEWTALGRALPRFAGHYQPRIPRDLGHYRLGDTPEGRAVMRRQAAMARAAGLAGFIHYFYWFNGRRLLESPVEAWLSDDGIDFPFCLMWANENWTRRWDGSEHEVLISQDYDTADDAGLVDCLARHFRDRRYIRIDGRPLLMIYRAADIPDTAATLARWRALFQERHGEAPLLVMAQSFDAYDPREFGFDAAVEFPPHKLARGLERRNAGLRLYDPRLTAHVYDYDDIVQASLTAPPPEFPLIRTAVPSWDNDARRQGAGLVLQGSTPAKYQAWLGELVARAAAEPPLGAPIVCVNAWNEWAEGAYLEPDQHFGAAYLNATARAVVRLPGRSAEGRLLLVGHDAFPAGAQQLLLHLLRRLRQGHGVEAEYLLLDGGALAPDYAASASGVVLGEAERSVDHVGQLARQWATRGFSAAIVNSAASAWVIPPLRAAGIAAVLMVHELPALLTEKGLLPGARAGTAASRAVVFAAAHVRDRFLAAISITPADMRVMPQGCYRTTRFSPRARREVRAGLGIGGGTVLVLGMGYADLRKGFDLFLQAWQATRRHGEAAVFCWLGTIEPAMRTYLAREIAAAEETGSFCLPGYQDDIIPWLSAADAFALTSREDPYPSVALEALSAGLPVVAFAGTGGIPDLLAEFGGGASVPLADADAMARALLKFGTRGLPGGRARLAARAQTAFSFADYTADLLALARPALAAVSVVVPSYNYAQYLPERLASVFSQTYPVSEAVLLDDASTDGSPDVAAQVAAEWGRDLRIETAPVNSGSVFHQWRRAAEVARGEFLWIAEADDAAEPELLARLVGVMRAQPNVDLVFSDSRAIDATGTMIWPSYREYLTGAGAAALTQDGVFDGPDFARRFLAERNLILNASAVLWRRSALLAAFERCGAELDRFSIAGDWRLYLEALATPGRAIGTVAAALNAHRRHAASVSAKERGRRHVDEIRRMHHIARTRLALDADARRRQTEYRRQLARELGLA